MINTSVNKIRESPRRLTVALVGLGGFGEAYLRGLLDENDGSAQLIAGVEPEPLRCGRLQHLKKLGIPIYPDISGLFDRHSPELVVIASPAHFHKQQGCAALA